MSWQSTIVLTAGIAGLVTLAVLVPATPWWATTSQITGIVMAGMFMP
jgi:hypothetical protein